MSNDNLEVQGGETERKIRTFDSVGGEIISTYAYPENAGRATGVPMERLRVDFKNGNITSEDSAFANELSSSLNDNSANAVRSLVMFSDIPIVLRSVGTSNIPLTGGNVHVIQNISEKDITIDLTAEAGNCDPAEASLAMIASNNPNPVYVPDSLQMSSPISKDGVTVDNNLFEEVFSRFVSPTSSYRINVYNKGGNAADVQLRSLIVSREVVEQSASVSSGDNVRFTVDAPMGIVRLFAKESTGGNSTDLEIEYEGEV